MSTQAFPLPTEFAYDENQGVIGKQHVISVPVEPAGFAGNPIVGGRRLYVSLSSDLAGADPARVRIAIHNGAGWNVSLIDVPSGGRVAVTVPPPKGDTAFNISVGRIRKSAASGVGESTIPVSLLVTVG